MFAKTFCSTPTYNHSTVLKMHKISRYTAYPNRHITYCHATFQHEKNNSLVTDVQQTEYDGLILTGLMEYVLVHVVHAVGHLSGFLVMVRFHLELGYMVDEVGGKFSNTLESTLCAKAVK